MSPSAPESRRECTSVTESVSQAKREREFELLQILVWPGLYFSHNLVFVLDAAVCLFICLFYLLVVVLAIERPVKTTNLL